MREAGQKGAAGEARVVREGLSRKGVQSLFRAVWLGLWGRGSQD